VAVEAVPGATEVPLPPSLGVSRAVAFEFEAACRGVLRGGKKEGVRRAAALPGVVFARPMALETALMCFLPAL
jgi:hypothetical protein